MRKRPRLRAALRGTFLAILVVVVAVGIVASSKTFQVCLHDANLPAGGPRLADRLEAAVQLAGVYRDCTSEFLRQNGEAITAALVVVLAFSTIGLWWAVRRLWLSGADHLAFAQETTRDAVVAIRQSLSSMERFRRELQSAPGVRRGSAARVPSHAPVEECRKNAHRARTPPYQLGRHERPDGQ
jgi:hypothetical protein